MKGLLNGGVNINWLLSGEGPVLLADLTAAPSAAPVPDSPIDYELLQSLIESLETALAEHDLILAPRRKAAVIQLMYEYCKLEDDVSAPVAVERFLKLVA